MARRRTEGSPDGRTLVDCVNVNKMRLTSVGRRPFDLRGKSLVILYDSKLCEVLGSRTVGLVIHSYSRGVPLTTRVLMGATARGQRGGRSGAATVIIGCGRWAKIFDVGLMEYRGNRFCSSRRCAMYPCYDKVSSIKTSGIARPVSRGGPSSSVPARGRDGTNCAPARDVDNGNVRRGLGAIARFSSSTGAVKMFGGTVNSRGKRPIIN